MLRDDGYDTMTDWWGLGITLYELLFDKNPFRRPDMVKKEQFEEFYEIVKNDILVFPP